MDKDARDELESSSALGQRAHITPNSDLSSQHNTARSGAVRHQQFILADPVAFSYLEEDPSVVVLERGRYLGGYQCYVVEQWACSRSHPTFVVIAYTGDTSNKIKVGVLSVPADEDSWSPRLKVYFRTLAQYHARRRETPLGTALVTNLSGFPSSLTLINVPDGDVRKHREDFVVNENLKRLGCSGRMGISIAPPTPAAEGKFHQLYRTSEKIELYKSVIELVKLCQAALMLFDILRPEYADGLFCDITEKAINDWWSEFGYDLYKIDPSDGILGPTTVAALLGTLIGARNRLHALGTPVAKDVFDIECTKRAIMHFQKSQHLHRTRRLDRQTLDSLHRVTAKHLSAEGWMVPRAVKSTVAELSGKGGEMVMDIVGRERSTLAEVETTDIERFAQLVKGERAKWLWQGRARRRTTRDLFDEHPGQVPHRLDEDLSLEQFTTVSSTQQLDHQEQESQDRGHRANADLKPRQAYQKHGRSPTADFMDPSKTVLNRAKGRLRGATFGTKKKQGPKTGRDALPMGAANLSYESFNSAKSELLLSPVDSVGDKPDNLFEEHRKDSQRISEDRRRENSRLQPNPTQFISNRMRPQSPASSKKTSPINGSREPIDLGQLDQRAADVVNTEVSVAEDIADGTDLDDLSPEQRPAQKIGPLLFRTESYSKFEEDRLEKKNRFRWPRQISFSAVEDILPKPTVIETYPEQNVSRAGTDPDEDPVSLSTYQAEFDLMTSPRDAALHEKVMETKQRALRDELARVGRTAGSWLITQVNEVAVLDSTAAQDADQMQQLYAPRKEEQRALAEGSHEVLREEKVRLGDSVRDLETLGQRVEYEIEGLRGKVEDMENSVSDFERQVSYVEDRVKELVKGREVEQKAQHVDGASDNSYESWSQWCKRKANAWVPQRDVKTVVSDAIKQTEVKVDAAVREAVRSSPLADSAGGTEVSLLQRAR